MISEYDEIYSSCFHGKFIANTDGFDSVQSNFIIDNDVEYDYLRFEVDLFSICEWSKDNEISIQINDQVYWSGSRHTNQQCIGNNAKNWETFPPRNQDISLIDPYYNEPNPVYEKKIGEICIFENVDIKFSITPLQRIIDLPSIILQIGDSIDGMYPLIYFQKDTTNLTIMFGFDNLTYANYELEIDTEYKVSIEISNELFVMYINDILIESGIDKQPVDTTPYRAHVPVYTGSTLPSDYKTAVVELKDISIYHYHEDIVSSEPIEHKRNEQTTTKLGDMVIESNLYVTFDLTLAPNQLLNGNSNKMITLTKLILLYIGEEEGNSPISNYELLTIEIPLKTRQIIIFYQGVEWKSEYDTEFILNFDEMYHLEVMLTPNYMTHFINDVLIFNYTLNTQFSSQLNEEHDNASYAVWTGHPTSRNSLIECIIDGLFVHTFDNPILKKNVMTKSESMLEQLNTQHIGDVMLANDIYINFEMSFGASDSELAYYRLENGTNDYLSSPILYPIYHQWDGRDYHSILSISSFLEISYDYVETSNATNTSNASNALVILWDSAELIKYELNSADIYNVIVEINDEIVSLRVNDDSVSANASFSWQSDDFYPVFMGSFFHENANVTLRNIFVKADSIEYSKQGITPIPTTATIDNTVEITPNINIKFYLKLNVLESEGTIFQIGEYFPIVELLNIAGKTKLNIRFVDNSNQATPHGISYLSYELSEINRQYLIDIRISEYFINIDIDDTPQIIEQSKASHSNYFETEQNLRIGSMITGDAEIQDLTIRSFYDDLFHFGWSPQTLPIGDIEISDNLFISFNMEILGKVSDFGTILEIGEYQPLLALQFVPNSYEMLIKFNDIKYETMIFESNKIYNIRIEIRQNWIAMYVDYNEIINYAKIDHNDIMELIEPVRVGSIWTQNAAVQITDVDIEQFDDGIFDTYYQYPLDSLWCRKTETFSDGSQEFDILYDQTSCKNSVHFDVLNIERNDKFEVKFESNADFAFANLTIKPMICDGSGDSSLIYSMHTFITNNDVDNANEWVFNKENIKSLVQNYLIFGLENEIDLLIDNISFNIQLGSPETIEIKERVWMIDINKNEEQMNCSIYNEYLDINELYVIDTTDVTFDSMWIDWDNNYNINSVRFGYGAIIGSNILCSANYYNADGWKYFEATFVEFSSLKNDYELIWNIFDRYENKICYENELYSKTINNIKSKEVWNDDCYESWFTLNDEKETNISTKIDMFDIYNNSDAVTFLHDITYYDSDTRCLHGPFNGDQYVNRLFMVTEEHSFIGIKLKLFGFGSWNPDPEFDNDYAIIYADGIKVWDGRFMYEYDYVDYNCQGFENNADWIDFETYSNQTSNTFDSDLISALNTLNLICVYDFEDEIKWIPHNKTDEPVLLTIYGHLNQEISNEAWGFGDVEIKYYSWQEFASQTSPPTTAVPTVTPTGYPTKNPTPKGKGAAFDVYKYLHFDKENPLAKYANGNNAIDSLSKPNVASFAILSLIIGCCIYWLFIAVCRNKRFYKYAHVKN